MTAILWFEHGKADFADYLIAALNHDAGAAPTYTFDRVAAAHGAFALLAS
jgi:predicted nucleic-acid-binding protein